MLVAGGGVWVGAAPASSAFWSPRIQPLLAGVRCSGDGSVGVPPRGWRSDGDVLVLWGFLPRAFCRRVAAPSIDGARLLRIIVAMVIAVESFISWMPMYGEIKLAFFVYLWYPKTKGSDIVYDTFLRPMVMQYEPNIEQRLLHLRARSGQLLTFYMKNFADKGTAFFVDVLRSVVSDEPGASISERNKKSSGWSPFATKRRPPSPPPHESIFGAGPVDLDAVAVAQAIRSSLAGAKPARRQYSGKY